MAQDLAEDGRPVKFLAQGTIYPDIIESGARKTGGKASTIKSHHNLIPFPEGVSFRPDRAAWTISSRTRCARWARRWVCPTTLCTASPSPGRAWPSASSATVTREKLDILKNADAIVREELDAYNERLFAETGERNSEHSVLAVLRRAARHQERWRHGRRAHLRAAPSSCAPWRARDAMTADWAKLPYDVLATDLAAAS